MEYESIRYSLFIKSYIAFALIKALREKYNIPPNMSRNIWRLRLMIFYPEIVEKIRKIWELKLDKEVQMDAGFFFVVLGDIERECTPTITTIAKELNIDENLFREFVLYGTSSCNVTLDDKIFYASKLQPIEEDGFFIKIKPDTTTRELQNLFEIVQERLNRHMCFEKHSQTNSLKTKLKLDNRKRKDIGKNDSKKINIYLDIEEKIKEIANFKVEQKRGLSWYEKDDYKGELVGPAIEQVAGEMIQDIESDEEFERLNNKIKKRLQTYYYQITARYKLPNVKDLNIVLGLINS